MEVDRELYERDLFLLELKENIQASINRVKEVEQIFWRKGLGVFEITTSSSTNDLDRKSVV